MTAGTPLDDVDAIAAGTIEEHAAGLVDRALQVWLADAVDAVLPAAIAVGSASRVDDPAVVAALADGATARADALCDAADMAAAETMVADVVALLVGNAHGSPRPTKARAGLARCAALPA